jgi:hypothetical protein
MPAFEQIGHAGMSLKPNSKLQIGWLSWRAANPDAGAFLRLKSNLSNSFNLICPVQPCLGKFFASMHE